MDRCAEVLCPQLQASTTFSYVKGKDTAISSPTGRLCLCSLCVDLPTPSSQFHVLICEMFQVLKKNFTLKLRFMKGYRNGYLSLGPNMHVSDALMCTYSYIDTHSLKYFKNYFLKI